MKDAVGSKRKEGAAPTSKSKVAPATKKAKVGKDGHPVGKGEDNEDEKNVLGRAKRGEKAHNTANKESGGSTKPKSKVPTHHETDGRTHEDQDGVLERGHIYFFYRPKVDIGPDDTCTSLDDVAKFYFLMLPRGDATNKQRFRLFIIGKKRLPDRALGGHEVFWATLSSFGDDFEHFKMDDALGERNYHTKTRGMHFYIHDQHSRLITINRG